MLRMISCGGQLLRETLATLGPMIGLAFAFVSLIFIIVSPGAASLSALVVAWLTAEAGVRFGQSG